MKFRDSKSMQRLRPPKVETSDRLTQKLQRAARRARQEEAAHWQEIEERVRAAEATARAVENHYRGQARRDRIKELREGRCDDEST